MFSSKRTQFLFPLVTLTVLESLMALRLLKQKKIVCFWDNH